MIIALEAAGFITNDIRYNQGRILRAVRENCGRADLVVFGEAFLQGFQSLSWSFEADQAVAVRESDAVISEIRRAAEQAHTAVSFGYMEKADGGIYSSQLTIGKDGKTLSNFRRVSAGWKESIADSHYREGSGFPKFSLDGKSFSVGLCGDFWYDENCAAAAALNADVVLWPVYTDFNYREWNASIKEEYAEQAAKLGNTVLYVNSCCLDEESDELARGGAAVFQGGRIPAEAPAGAEAVLRFRIG